AGFSVLCVHEMGHDVAEPELVPLWTTAISEGIHRANPTLNLQFKFLDCTDLFDRAPCDPDRYRLAMARLFASGFICGVSDEFGGTKELFDIPEPVRLVAGRLAQWASDDDLRRQLRVRVLEAMIKGRYRLVCAHGIASLGCYDALRRNPAAVKNCSLRAVAAPLGTALPCDRLCGRT